MTTPLLAILLLLPLSALAQTQVPNVFEDGTPATAAEVNENFQYVLENASGGGGYSAEQADNTAEITCADGTTAVVPGYGTVVVYGNGIVGELPPLDYNTGSIVLKDNANVVLGEVLTGNRENCFDLILNESEQRFATVCNVSSSETVRFTGQSYNAYFIEPDCSGVPFTSSPGVVLELTGQYWIVPVSAPNSEEILFRSYRSAAHEYASDTGACVAMNIIKAARPIATYTPAPEILNAAYPVRLEQLP